MPDKPSKLLDQARKRIRAKHYRLRTEQTCVQRIRRFIVFHDMRHPKELGGPEVEAFLTNLGTQRKVAAPTQTPALCAVLFLYKEVLGIQRPWLEHVTRAMKSSIFRSTASGCPAC